MHSPASSAHWLSSWLQTPAGERLLAEQAPIIAQEVRRFHGDSLLWLGCHSPSSEIVRRCMIRYRFYAALPGSCPSADLASFSGDPQALPLPKASVNAVVIHHGLECVRDPRQVMREVSRVLVPGGKLLIAGFAPLSTWGVRYLRDRSLELLRRERACLRPLGQRRLLDWLAVLDFALTEQYTLTHRRPVRALQSRLRALRWLPEEWPTGGRSYVVAATKQQAGYLLPGAPAQLKDRALAPVAYPKLSSWRRVERDR